MFSLQIIQNKAKINRPCTLCSVQGAETSCVCVCTKRVCVKFTEPKVCTVGIYSTYESRYMYSLGEYICLLLIVNLQSSATAFLMPDHAISFPFIPIPWQCASCV